MRDRLKIILCTVVTIGILYPAFVSSESRHSDGSTKDQSRVVSLAGPRDLFQFGRQRLGFVAGYGFGLPLGRGDLDDLQFVRLAPQWGIGISDPLGGNSWYRGNFELVVEPFFLGVFEPKNGLAGGLDLLVRYNFLRQGRLIPFIEAGGGVSAIDFDLRRQSDGFNFTVQAGIGAHYFLTDRLSLMGQWRYHHISNADIRQPNTGINNSLFILGISLFFGN